MTTLTEYEVHPAAELFPMMDAKAFAELKADIDANGVRECVTLYDGKLIDGRNRYKAMRELGIDPACHAAELETCDDPIAFVLSLNLHRRHLNETQRATVAAKIANLKVGEAGNGRKVGAQICASTESDAAEMLSVGKRTVQSAKHAISKGAPEVVEAMERGEIAASAAANLVDAVPDKAEQVAIVKKGKKAVAEAAKKAKPKKEKPLDSSPKGECVKGGSHEWTTDDDGEYCSKCKEDREPKAKSKAKSESRGVERFCKVFWDDATKAERLAVRAWINDQDI